MEAFRVGHAIPTDFPLGAEQAAEEVGTAPQPPHVLALNGGLTRHFLHGVNGSHRFDLASPILPPCIPRVQTNLSAHCPLCPFEK